MDNSIFRKKSMERISSPEQLNDFLRVTNPSIWIVLSGIIVFLIGVCVWGIFGTLETKVKATALVSGDTTVCYISAESKDKLEIGQTVSIEGNEYSLAEFATEPILVTEDFPEYALYVGELRVGEWVYLARLTNISTIDNKLNDGIYGASVVVESVNPISFLFD